MGLGVGFANVGTTGAELIATDGLEKTDTGPDKSGTDGLPPEVDSLKDVVDLVGVVIVGLTARLGIGGLITELGICGLRTELGICGLITELGICGLITELAIGGLIARVGIVFVGKVGVRAGVGGARLEEGMSEDD